VARIWPEADGLVQQRPCGGGFGSSGAECGQRDNLRSGWALPVLARRWLGSGLDFRADEVQLTVPTTDAHA
jgi:hypothetical protein